MTQPPQTRFGQGIVPLTGFALFTAALDVYAGNQLQAHDPATVAAISFTVACVFFIAVTAVRAGLVETFRPLRTSRYDVVMINVTTAVTWLSMLYALKFLEPAVVNVVGLALGPLFTILLSPLLRPGTSVLRTEILVSFGITALIGLLVWGSFTGRSGVGELGSTEVIVGVGLTLLTGIGSVANVIYSKRLSDTGLAPQSVLAIRFFLMLAVTWVLVATNDAPGLQAALVPSAVIAVIGVALPLYLLQVGIRHTEPITASILLTLSPLFAYLLQLPDRRLTPSALTLAGVLGITALVAVGTLARIRHDRATPDGEPIVQSPPSPAERHTA
jgi:drug/metabolite transporter (DMT)-like permease